MQSSNMVKVRFKIIDEAIGKTSELNLQSVAVVDELIQLCRDITPLW